MCECVLFIKIPRWRGWWREIFNIQTNQINLFLFPFYRQLFCGGEGREEKQYLQKKSVIPESLRNHAEFNPFLSSVWNVLTEGTGSPCLTRLPLWLVSHQTLLWRELDASLSFWELKVQNNFFSKASAAITCLMNGFTLITNCFKK